MYDDKDMDIGHFSAHCTFSFLNASSFKSCVRVWKLCIKWWDGFAFLIGKLKYRHSLQWLCQWVTAVANKLDTVLSH